MAFKLDINPFIQILEINGYKELAHRYHVLLSKGVEFNCTFNSISAKLPNGDVYEAVMPTTFSQVKNNIQNKALITPLVLDLNSFLGAMTDLVDGQEVTSSNVVITTETGNPIPEPPQYTDDQLLSELKEVSGSSSSAVNTQAVDKNTALGKAIGGMMTADPPFNEPEKAQSIALKLFKDVGKIGMSEFTDNMSKLTDVQSLLQPVYGTSTTSSYYAIALGAYKGKTVNGALKITDPETGSVSVSIRYEWADKGVVDTAFESNFKENGFTVKEGYASIHFLALKADAARLVTSLMYSLNLDYKATAKIIFDYGT